MADTEPVDINNEGYRNHGNSGEQYTPNGLIIPDTPSSINGSPTLQNRLPEGSTHALNATRSKLRQLTGGNLTITSTGLEVPDSSLTIPATQDNDYLAVPDDKEVERYVAPTPVMPSEVRTSTEIALARRNLPLFLANETRSKLEAETHHLPQLEEVLAHIGALPQFRANSAPNVEAYSPSVAQRHVRSSRYFDKSQGKIAERTISRPGTLEAAGIVMADMLYETEFR